MTFLICVITLNFIDLKFLRARGDFFLRLLFLVANASEAVTLSYTANTLTHASSTVYACRKTHKQVYAFILEKHTAASCSTVAAAEEP